MTAQGLRELLAGDKLTDRELQVLHGAAMGETAGQTAERVHLAVDTVKMHRKTACAKLDAPNMTRAVVVAIAAGVLNVERLGLLDSRRTAWYNLSYADLRQDGTSDPA